MLALLHSVVDVFTDPALPGGCLVVSGTGACDAPSIPERVKQALREALRGSESAIEARLARAQLDGTLPAHVNVSALSAYFNTVVAGLGIQSKGGACRAALRDVVDTAMRAWPTA
jgi:hypothetical protein